MTDIEQSTTPPHPPGPSRARYFRFALYAAVLLAALLWAWDRHVERAREEQAEAVERAAADERIAEARRYQAVVLLMRAAYAAKDPDERVRGYDKVIAACRNEKTLRFQQCAAWATYWKGLHVPDAAEKIRLFDEVIDTYLTVRDKDVEDCVRWAINERLELADGGDSGKAALCDSLLAKYGDRLSGPVAVQILSGKAEAARSEAERLAIYDAILARLPTFPGDASLELVMMAALVKAGLIDDRAERLRLCDLAIDAFLQEPSRLAYYQFLEAATLKAALVGDPALVLRLCDQVIANNRSESSVVQARFMRIEQLRDDRERIAALDEIIERHGGSGSDYVQLMVCHAMQHTARLLTDPEAQKAQYRAVIERCGKVKDESAKGVVDAAVEQLARLDGDLTPALRRYDDAIAKAESELEAARALWRKALLVGEPEEKIRLFDELIAMGRDSRDEKMRNLATSAMVQKARIVDDKAEKIRLYDGIIAMGRDSRDVWLSGEVMDAMKEKARLVDDKGEKARLYDEILSGAAEGRIDDFAYKTLRERVALVDDKAEKVRIYDNYLAGDVKSEDRIDILLDKVAYLDDPAAALRLYDEVIALCRRELGMDDARGRWSSRVGGRSAFLLQYRLGKAILGKGDLVDNPDAMLKLYDEYLAIPLPEDHSFAPMHIDKILSRKAALVGDPTLRNSYYDERIRAATTDGERVDWYAWKALAATDWREKQSIQDEIIATFLDNTDERVEWHVAHALLSKIQLGSDPAESVKLCDVLIDRYLDSANRETRYPVAYALDFKARQASDREEKRTLYDTLIARYKGEDNPLIADMVKTAIVAKAALTENEGAGK